MTTGIVIGNVKAKQMDRMNSDGRMTGIGKVNAKAKQIDRDDRKNTSPSGDDVSVNNGVDEVTRVTGEYNVASNKMGHQQLEKRKKD